MINNIKFSAVMISMSFANLSAQTIINNPDETSVLIEFDSTGSDNTKGLILPAIKTVDDVSTVNGSFVFDKADSKVKMREGNQWIELTGNDGSGSRTSLIENEANDVGKGVIVGANSSSADGVLVLESPDKALKLPFVSNPHLTVKSPYPGMMCYDTISKSVAFFDGTKWYFWK
jgi:hypothetical protein